MTILETILKSLRSAASYNKHELAADKGAQRLIGNIRF